MRKRSSKALNIQAGLACLLLLHGCRSGSRLSIGGSYSTVSESEWNIILILKKGDTAEILEESWAPGEYEGRSTIKTEGRWRLDGNSVVLEYAGVTDRLAYNPALSLAILGYQGGAAGLQQTGTFAEDSILRDEPLWKLPHEFAETSAPR